VARVPAFALRVWQPHGWGWPWAFIVASLIALLLVVAPATADKRVALVIGNSAYQRASGLPAAVGDAQIVAAALQSTGFSLSGGAALTDLDRTGLERAVQQFERDIADADVALFYYAGHAVQLYDSNFLVPVDAAPAKEDDIDRQMLEVDAVLHAMEGSAKRLNLVVLDAAHLNPFEGRGLSGLETGLAPIHAPENTLVFYAAQPDVAVPESSASNSLFAVSLAEMIQRPSLGLFDVVNETGLKVRRSTGGAQQPYVAFSPINGHFLFAAAPASMPKPLNKRLNGERVVLYDEDASDPNGKVYEGSVVWRSEETKTDRILRGDLEIPERKLKAVITLRPNSDRALPASHVAEFTFTLPPDFIGGGIGSVPGMLMKTREDAPGAALAGLAVKLTDGSFLIGLSKSDSDRQRNMQLLQERSWFDVPLVYKNKRRGILAISKGTSGGRAFDETLAAWSNHP
jgi:hypothetical protein